MSNPRETFPTLKDSDGAGIVLDQALDGATEVAGKNGAIGFAFKDSDGNVVLPQLTEDGKIMVDTEAYAGTEKSNYGTVVNLAKNTRTKVAEISALALSKVHELMFKEGACTQPCLWEIEIMNDAAPTIISAWLTGSGQYSQAAAPKAVTFTPSGVTTRKITLYATIFDGKASDVFGSIAVNERGAS
jgi:hypothetical protein